MEDLAIAYVTCDGYSHIWDSWHEQFTTYWDLKVPQYFLGEEKKCPWEGWVQIPHHRVGPEKWTTKLRAQLEEIPEENIFVWLDDLVMQTRITSEFVQVYSLFKTLGADSFRIMPRRSASRMTGMPYTINGSRVMKLLLGSPYTVSFSPNIYRKEFLLEVLQHDESPWDCELKSHDRVKGNIYSVQIDGWVDNVIVKGKYI